ncbi:hypothetical protein MASR2M17_23550 [Aminivibrio sp.]
MKIATIADLIAYRSRKDSLVRRVAEARMPTCYGEFTIVATRTTSTATPTSPWSRARSTRRPRCWCACTASA